MFGVEFGNEAMNALVDELGTVICDERLRDSKRGEHVSLVEAEDVMRGDFREGFDLYFVK